MRMRMFGLAAILLLAVQTSHAEDKKITIWWAQWDPAAALQELGHEFAEETGIAVEVYQIPWPAYQDQVFLNFGNKQTDFDIVVGDSQWIGRGATKGLYLELTDWLPEAVDMGAIHPRAARYLCEYPPGSSRFFRRALPDGCHWFCVSQATGLQTQPSRRRLPARYGRPLAAPDTWEEFRDVAEFFHRPEQKRYGCSLLTGQGVRLHRHGLSALFCGLGAARGATPQSYKVQGHLNTEGAVAGLEFFKSLLQFTARRWDECRLLLQLRGVLQRLYGYGLGTTFRSIRASSPAWVIRSAFSWCRATATKRVISLGGQGFSISTKTTPAKAGMGPSGLSRGFPRLPYKKKWISYPGSFTANTELLASEEFAAAAPYNAVFASSLDHLQDFWNVPVYNELLAAAVRHLGAALDGTSASEEALDALAAEHEMILMEAGLLEME